MRKSTLAAAVLIPIIIVVTSFGLYSLLKTFYHQSDQGTSGNGNQNTEFVYEPFNALPYVNQNELSEANSLLSSISTFIDQLFSFGASACVKLATPNSPTVITVANQLIAFYPNNREWQAKEIYYWVSDWISYDYAASGDFLRGTQRELPVQTINDRTGVCLNYAVVLASLYEAAGFQAKIMCTWNSGTWPWDREDYHALTLLYLPGYSEYYQPFNDGWILLDPTAGGSFGLEHYTNYSQYDIADVS